MTMQRRGSCLCGQVQLEFSTAPLVIATCHCRHCQQTSGSAFSLVAVMPADGVRITGTLSEYHDTSDAGTAVTRRFCGACGSPVETASAELAQQGQRIIKLGLFPDVTDLQPVMEVFCRGRAAWLPDFTGTQSFHMMPGG